MIEGNDFASEDVRGTIFRWGANIQTRQSLWCAEQEHKDQQFPKQNDIILNQGKLE
jgi:hypothetical protein